MRNDKLYFGIGIAIILIVGTILSALTNNQVANKLQREAESATVEAIPTYVVNLMQTARQHVNAQEWEEAIPVLQEILTLSPESVEANQLLISMYTGASDNEALDAFVQDLIEQSKQMSDASQRALLDISIVLYFETNQDFQAIIDYVESSNPEITAPQIDWSIARAYYNTEAYENSKIYFLRIESREPDHEPTQFDLGRVSLELQAYEDAIDYFTHAIELNPDRIENVYLRGVAYYELGMIEQASEDFTTYIDMGGDEENVAIYFE